MTSTDDPDWIRGLVAKALLDEHDSATDHSGVPSVVVPTTIIEPDGVRPPAVEPPPVQPPPVQPPPVELSPVVEPAPEETKSFRFGAESPPPRPFDDAVDDAVSDAKIVDTPSAEAEVAPPSMFTRAVDPVQTDVLPDEFEGFAETEIQEHPTTDPLDAFYNDPDIEPVPANTITHVPDIVDAPRAEPDLNDLDINAYASTDNRLPQIDSNDMSRFLGEEQVARTGLDGGGSDEVLGEVEAETEGYQTSDVRTIVEWLAVIVSALIVALLIKEYVLQAFWIPSGSMETTVNEGDRILVNKVSYRLHDVRRGDLVVFEKLPDTPGDTKDLIKRAVALPGETIEVRADGRIWIWRAGETAEDALLLEEPYLDPQNRELAEPSPTDSLSVDIWDEACVNQKRTPGRCTLGPDSYFMMGDNRFASSDSRFFGPIPRENIVGRAFFRIWPIGDISTL